MANVLGVAPKLICDDSKWFHGQNFVWCAKKNLINNRSAGIQFSDSQSSAGRRTGASAGTAKKTSDRSGQSVEIRRSAYKGAALE